MIDIKIKVYNLKYTLIFFLLNKVVNLLKGNLKDTYLLKSTFFPYYF